MAKKSKIARAAERVGGALGRADRKAHKIAQAGSVAKEELHAISRKVDALKRQLERTTKRLQRAIR